MLRTAFKVFSSIRAKLLFAFLVIGVIVIAIGVYANRGIHETGDMVMRTYDGPLQARTHAESARYLFSRIETSLLHETLRVREGQEIDWTEIKGLLEEFSLDMGVVSDTSITPKAAPYIAETNAMIAAFKTDIDTRDSQFDGQLYFRFQNDFNIIYTSLDVISELQASAGFAERDMAASFVQHKVSNIMLFIFSAFILAVALAFWLIVTILDPLKMAANVANKVSSGDYDVDIPQGRQDETGLLLHSMSIMQKNIRSFIARERNEKDVAKDNLSAALKNSKDAIMITNADGKITIANEKVKSLFPQVIDDEFIGGDLFRYFNPAGHPVKGAIQTFDQTDEMRLESGTWTKINASDMEEGGRLFIWNDITDLKAREVSLRIAKDKAEAANQSKTLFLASMSHELRTPLNAVIGFSDLIAQQALGPIENLEYVELSQQILESGESLLTMIEDVLIIAGTRNESRETLDFEDVNLTPIIYTALEKIKESCKAQNIGLIWVKPDHDYTVNCNIQRLNRIFMSILANAARRTRAGIGKDVGGAAWREYIYSVKTRTWHCCAYFLTR